MTRAYESKELQKEAGITPRQMDLWYRRGWLQPIDRKGAGSGVPHAWPEETVKKAVLMGRLLRAGFIVRRAEEIASDYMKFNVTDGYQIVRLETGMALELAFTASGVKLP